MAQADVCIVGAGAAGMTLARALRHAGRSVLLLESGPVADDDLDRGEVVGLPYNGLVAGRRRGPGGTTSVWPGQSMRLRPEDAARWPIALDRWFEEAERLLGLVPGETARDPWDLFGEEPPAFDDRIAYAVSAFAPRRDLSALTPARTGTTVTRVEPGAVETADGERVRAGTVVLCAGTLETTRLLLASGFDHPSLGRFFNDHAACRPARLTGDARELQDRYGLRLRAGQTYSPKLVLRGGATGCMANVTFAYDERSPVEAALRVRRALRARTRPGVRDLRLAAAGMPQLLSAGARVARGREPAPRPESIDLLAILEQPLRAESALTLADTRDRLGVPRLRVDWRVGDEEHDALQALVAAVGDAVPLEPAAWLGTSTWREHVFDCFHPAGTARMGDVVDTDCALTGVPGVYVCGAAVFPASGCVNPTLTIVALALRLAEHLR